MKPFLASMLLLLALSVSACGDDREERGLVDDLPQDSTPESAAEMQKTEQQRQQENLQEEQQKESEEFDAAEQ